MSDGQIILPPDSTGKILDTEELTVGADTVQRERMRIAGATAGDLLTVTAADGALVNLGTNNDVTVASLPLPTGAATEVTLAAAVLALQIMDDWDETDRAKVNLIAGQAGITAGAGAVAANTPRVTHASDDPVTTAIQIMDDWDEADRAKVNPIAGQAGVAAGSGASSALTQRVIAATDSPEVISLAIIDDWDEADRAKVNPIAGQAGVQGASGVVTALTQRVVLATDVALPAGTALLGAVNPKPVVADGLLIHKNLDVDETEDEIKGSAGAIYGWFITNRATSVRYVKLYNATAASVTVGTTVPVMTLAIPGNATDFIAANALGGMGIKFDTAITIAATTGLADNDTGAPGANDVVANIFYI